MESNCKGCRVSVRVSEEEIKRIISETMQDQDVKLVSQDDYLSRLNLCRECLSLDYGTTCRHCGCLVPVRAWFADKGCPDPAGAKW